MLIMLAVMLMVLILLNSRIAVAMGLVALAYVLAKGIPVTVMVQRMVGGINSFSLLAIPLFILAAHLMNNGGVTERIMNACRAVVGHVRGGLAHVNILGSLIFAGMSGSALADASGLGSVEVKVMEKEGYTKEFAAACTATSATIGPIFPPSIPLLLYASMTDTSIGRLFAGGLVPGVLMAVALMLYISLVAKRMNLPAEPWPGIAGVARAIWQGILPLMAPVILLGGMFMGVFTPTEAAVVTVLYSLLLVGIAYRTFSLRDLWPMMLSAVETSGVVLFTLGTGSILAYALVSERAGQVLVNAVAGLDLSPVVLLLVLNVAFLVIGAIMETGAILVIFVPVLMPLLAKFGVDPVHFGVLLVLNLMIGLVTPPIGLVLYLMMNLTGVTLSRLVRAAAPMIGALVVVLLAITLYPDFVLWLPNTLFGR